MAVWVEGRSGIAGLLMGRKLWFWVLFGLSLVRTGVMVGLVEEECRRSWSVEWWLRLVGGL